MPVETSWYLEKRISYQRFHGVVVPEDFGYSIQETGRYVAEGMSPVHVIADLRDIEKYPPLFKLSGQARHESYAGVGWTVIVVSQPVVRFIATVLTQFTVSPYHTSPTMEDALEFLTLRDRTLTLS